MVLTPDPIVVITTIVAPTVVNPTSLTPVVVSAITSVVAPTIVLSALTLTPDAVTGTSSVTEPDVFTGEILYPDVIVVDTDIVLPVVRKGARTLTPDVISSNAVVIGPAVYNPTIFVPVVVSTITSVEAPSVVVSGTVAITAPIVTSATLVLLPTFVSGSGIVITPDDIVAAAAVVDPLLVMGLRITVPAITVTTAVTTPNLTIGSIVYTLHPSGRRQIAVDQLQGGEKYPFVNPSDDLDQLLGDLYLNYVDDTCAFELPFSIKWLRGFGTEVAPDPIGEINDYDLEIIDANGATVFDSRAATVFKTTPWGDDNGVFATVAEWIDENTGAILRAVVYTAWETEALARDWPIYFEPAVGTLDPRTLESLPPYVSQFAIVNDLDDEAEDDNIESGENVVFTGGYNSVVEHMLDDEVIVDGGAYTRVIQIDLEPGTGLGRYPCEPEVLIKQINGVTPNALGNVIIDATDCWRAERPLTAVDLEGHEAAVVEAALQLINSCGPCCDCESFAKVYKAIKALDKRYRDFGIRAEAIRDQFLANRNRWTESASCRAEGGVSIQIAAEAFPGCKVAFGIGVCNNTDSPLQNVKLKVDFDYGPGDPNYVEPADPEATPITATNTLAGCILCNSTSRRNNVHPSVGSGKYTRPYKIEGVWPNFSMGFDCINPGDLGTVTWVMKFEGCSSSDVVELVVIHDGKVYKKSVSLMSDIDDDCCEDGTTSNSSESSEAP
jgi:hypothetical protein